MDEQDILRTYEWLHQMVGDRFITGLISHDEYMETTQRYARITDRAITALREARCAKQAG